MTQRRISLQAQLGSLVGQMHPAELEALCRAAQQILDRRKR